MEAFNKDIQGLKAYIDAKAKAERNVRVPDSHPWEKKHQGFSAAGNNSIVLEED